jgi:leader peptidase (prepilin peptidase) / N-methyltransferase
LLEFGVFVFGLILGSFLNMLIYRLPLEISLLNPKRSICPNCAYQLKWYENIPFFSYLFLRGKCSNCQGEISLIYPIVELLTAIIFVLIYIKVGLTMEFFILLLLSGNLIVLSFIDIKYKAVPDYLLLLVLICSFFIEGFSYMDCLIFAGGAVMLEFFITFYIQNIKARIYKDEALMVQKSLGEGDIPIFALIGGILGIHLGIISIFLAAVFAIIPSLVNLIRHNELELPFIPFLSLGFIMVYLFDEKVLLLMEKINL